MRLISASFQNRYARRIGFCGPRAYVPNSREVPRSFPSVDAKRIEHTVPGDVSYARRGTRCRGDADAETILP